MNVKRTLSKIADWIANIFLMVVGVFLLWFFAQLFVYASFTIPTYSMTPTLIPGDKIYVNKLMMGARIFDFMGAVGGKQVTIYRTPGYRDIHRGDVVVFNFPYACAWDSLAMDIAKYYVKRCVAIPGDTIELRDCSYFVNDSLRSVAPYGSSEMLCRFLNENSENPDLIARNVVTQAFPNDSVVEWTIKDFGPMVVPAKGTEIEINMFTALIYRNYIEWEASEKLTVVDGTILLGGRRIDRYRFQQNYYFVAGDNAFDSQDSRYWGLLPEPYIVGRAVFIWKSVDKYTGKERKNRKFMRL